MSVTSEQDKPSDGDPEKDLRAMKAEFQEAGIDPPGGEPPDVIDDTGDDGNNENAKPESCEKELSNALSHAKSFYTLETKRVEVFKSLFEDMSLATCKFIPADSEQVKPNWLTDNIVFAHEEAAIAIFRAIEGIANRSDSVLLASQVFALGDAARTDKNTQGSADSCK